MTDLIGSIVILGLLFLAGCVVFIVSGFVYGGFLQIVEYIGKTVDSSRRPTRTH